jgi:hypothetical protein
LLSDGLMPGGQPASSSEQALAQIGLVSPSRVDELSDYL